jgi:purine nucleoside phosphorylase
MLAIIGGSGLTQLANLNVIRREVVRTPTASLPGRSPSASCASTRWSFWPGTAMATRSRPIG